MEDVKQKEIWKRGEEILNEYHRKIAERNFEQFLAENKKGDKGNG